MNKVEYWIDLSDYDIETAKVMLKSLTVEKCQDIIKNTEELQKWIKMKL